MGYVVEWCGRCRPPHQMRRLEAITGCQLGHCGRAEGQVAEDQGAVQGITTVAGFHQVLLPDFTTRSLSVYFFFFLFFLFLNLVGKSLVYGEGRCLMVSRVVNA